MITESDVYKEHPGTTFAWALLASLLFNLVAWVVALWLSDLHIVLPQPKIEEREYQIFTSSMTISHRPVPKPQPRIVPAPAAQSQPQREEQQQRVAVRTVAPQETPHPLATIAQHPLTVAESIAAQQQNLEKAAQAMRAARAPLSIATLPPRPPSSVRETFADINGVDTRDHVEAILMPLPGEHWLGNGMSCYYVHYSAQWSGGGSEEGTIPWPVCYPANHDAMLPLNRVHDLPIPVPPRGYVLPPGTPLSPLLLRIYEGAVHG